MRGVNQHRPPPPPPLRNPNLIGSSPTLNTAILGTRETMGRITERSTQPALQEKALQIAITSWRTGQYPTLALCASMNQVKYTTLWQRVKNHRQSRTKAHETQQLLLPCQERGIVRWIKGLDAKGFPPRTDMVITLARQLMKATQQNSSIEDIDIGKHFITRFLNRHPELTSKFTRQINKQRVMGEEASYIRKCGERLRVVMEKRKIKPHNMYNMDEKGILMGVASKVKVICVRGKRNPSLVQGIENSTLHYTIIGFLI